MAPSPEGHEAFLLLSCLPACAPPAAGRCRCYPPLAPLLDELLAHVRGPSRRRGVKAFALPPSAPATHPIAPLVQATGLFPITNRPELIRAFAAPLTLTRLTRLAGAFVAQPPPFGAKAVRLTLQMASCDGTAVLTPTGGALDSKSRLCHRLLLYLWVDLERQEAPPPGGDEASFCWGCVRTTKAPPPSGDEASLLLVLLCYMCCRVL